MMDQSGHKSIDTLRGYVRDAELFKDHAGAGLLWVSASERPALGEPGVARVGTGPILRIGKNQKAPLCSAHQIDQTMMQHSQFCKNEMIFAACASCLLASCLKKKTAGRQVGSGQR